MPLRRALDEDGFAIVDSVIDEAEVVSIAQALASVPMDGAGTRNLLSASWCCALASRLRTHATLEDLLPAASVGVQCTLFDKTAQANWLVALHQDLSVPVQSRVEHAELRTWSTKEGQHFVQPPAELLDQLVAVRLHIDDCESDNGPLRVVPGSHRRGRIAEARLRDLRDAIGEVECPVARGGALVFKPLLVHASSKASTPRRRRVLHFLFGPASPGYGLRWQYAA